jgi:beta-glucanase (GH16 family)
MKRLTLYTLPFILFIFFNQRATSQINKKYKLIWSDEFNYTGKPDSSKWGYNLGAGGWGNNEAEYYTNRIDNATVKNGTLKIIAKKEKYDSSEYTSARLLTKNKFSFTYGKVVARAKIPFGKGTWPAIWMLGANDETVGWPDCGEIDIMEHAGNRLNKIYGTLHYPGHSGGEADGSIIMVKNVTTTFHIYSVEWDSAAVNISVDGRLIHSVVNSGKIPFNHNFFLIMNVAMGGGFGGTIDTAFKSAAMEVDYIRVYQIL